MHLGDVVGRAFPGTFAGDIERQWKSADFCSLSFASGQIDVGGNYLCAFGCHLARNSGADALRGAGDQRHLACQPVTHHAFSPRPFPGPRGPDAC